MKSRQFLPLAWSSFVACWIISGWVPEAAGVMEHPAMFNGEKPSKVIELAGPGYEAGSAAFSPDGSRLMIGYGDGTVRFYDASTGRDAGVIQVSAAHDTAYATAFSPDGLRFAATAPFRDPKATGLSKEFAGNDHAVTVWDLEGNVVRRLPPMSGRILVVAFDAGGERVGALDHHYVLKAWRVGEGVEDFATEVHKASGQQAQTPSIRAGISADLRRAVVKDETPATNFGERTIRLIEVGAKEPRFIHFDAGMIRSVAISADGSRVVTANLGQTACVNDFASGRRLKFRFMSLPYQVPGISFPDFAAFMPDGRRVLTGTEHGQVFVHDFGRDGDGPRAIQGPRGFIRAAAFLGDRIRLVSGGWEALGDERIEGTRDQKFEPVTLWEVLGTK